MENGILFFFFGKVGGGNGVVASPAGMKLLDCVQKGVHTAATRLQQSLMTSVLMAASANSTIVSVQWNSSTVYKYLWDIH